MRIILAEFFNCSSEISIAQSELGSTNLSRSIRTFSRAPEPYSISVTFGPRDFAISAALFLRIPISVLVG